GVFDRLVCLPGRADRNGAEHPAVVVQPLHTCHFEILSLVPRGSIWVVEAVNHADALDRLLRDAVHHFRGWYAGCLPNGGRNIDQMVELRANAARVFDVAWPRDRRSLADAAEEARDLLGPFEGRAERPRPTDRKQRVGLVGAPGVVPLHLLR